MTPLFEKKFGRRMAYGKLCVAKGTKVLLTVKGDDAIFDFALWLV